MYKVLFFDLDDTLWDTYTNGKESMEEVYRDYRFDRFFSSFEDYYAVYYSNNCRLWEEYRNGKINKEELIFRRLDFPLRPYMTCDREFILALNEDFLNRTVARKKLLPQAMETLEYLYPRYPMFIISNGFEEVQYRKMDNSGLTPFFRGMILSDKVGVNKPNPLIFESALKEAGCASGEVLMIGDSWDADIAGAKNSGIDQCWYDLGVETPGIFEPTYRIVSLSELTDFL